MSITFNEPTYQFQPVKFNVDEQFGNHIKEPFANESFMWVTVGKPKSGKTSLVINSLIAKGKNRVYNKVFNKIILVMPKNSKKSITKPPFDDLAEDQKFEMFDENVVAKIEQIKEEFDLKNDELQKKGKPKKQFNQLLIMDDITAHLKSKESVKNLIDLCSNRRHLNLSIILMVQFLRSIVKPVRFQITHITFFKPSNELDTDILQEEFINLKKEDFNELKRQVWKDQHDFIMIDKNTDTYYRNLQKINFHKLEDEKI
jgi:hypothetical protein